MWRRLSDVAPALKPAIACWRDDVAETRVAALVGDSGSGKTTAIIGLINLYRSEGLRIGAIKHTHHEVNERDQGDTSLMRRAGASPLILAGESEAVIFDGVN